MKKALTLVGSNVTYVGSGTTAVIERRAIRAAERAMQVLEALPEWVTEPRKIKMVLLCDECHQVPVAEVWKERKCDDCLRRIVLLADEREHARRAKRMALELFGLSVVAAGLVVVGFLYVSKLFVR